MTGSATFFRASDEPILHVDGDEFFASLARLKEPRIGDRPVVVGHLRSRGSVVAASYAARQAGVKPGQTMAHARRLCPDAVQVQVDWAFVRRASAAFLAVLSRYSPVVEAVGPDAAFLDYSGCRYLFGAPEDFACRLQREVRDVLKWGVSVGLSSDKAASVVACRAAKAGHVEVVAAGDEFAFMRRYPVSWLPGLRPSWAVKLAEMGVQTIGDLATIPVAILGHIWGEAGRRLAIRARGEERSPVRRSGSSALEVSRHFSEDILDIEELEARLAELASLLAGKLRSIRRSAPAVTLRLTYSDGVSARREACLSPPSHRDPELFRAVRRVLPELYRRRVRIRAISLEVSRLAHIPAELPLMDDARRRVKWDRVLSAMDTIRSRCGLTSSSRPPVALGAVLPARSLSI